MNTISHVFPVVPSDVIEEVKKKCGDSLPCASCPLVGRDCPLFSYMITELENKVFEVNTYLQGMKTIMKATAHISRGGFH